MQGQHVRKLVELILGEPIAAYIDPRRDRGDSYDDISYEITTTLRARCVEHRLEPDVKVTAETLRRWHQAAAS